MDTAVSQEGRFRPASKDAFTQYTKNLAWLIKRPLQQAQEVLARIYGYSGLHELQEELAKPGAAGPYTSAQHSEEFMENITRRMALETERGNRVLKLLADLHGTDLGKMPSRWWKARELGLFEPPAANRDLFRQIKTTIEVRSGEGPGATTLADFATVAYALEGEAYFSFTQLGGAIYDALREIEESVENGALDDVDDDLKPLLEKYPTNPWVWATRASLMQDEDLSPKLTAALLEDAQRALIGFEAILGKDKRKVANPKLVTHPGSYGSDTWTYPHTLFLAGAAAFNLGDDKKAEPWLSRAFASQEGHDGFGTRFMLAPARLNLGKRNVGNLFPHDPLDPSSEIPAHSLFMHVVHEYLRGNRAKVVARHLAGCIGQLSIASVDDELRIACRHDPWLEQMCDECDDFWPRHPEFIPKLAAVLSDPLVLSVVARGRGGTAEAEVAIEAAWAREFAVTATA